MGDGLPQNMLMAFVAGTWGEGVLYTCIDID